MTLNDLAKFSMTRSVARSLCDNWASCFYISVEICIASCCYCCRRGVTTIITVAARIYICASVSSDLKALYKSVIIINIGFLHCNITPAHHVLW